MESIHPSRTGKSTIKPSRVDVDVIVNVDPPPPPVLQSTHSLPCVAAKYLQSSIKIIILADQFIAPRGGFGFCFSKSAHVNGDTHTFHKVRTWIIIARPRRDGTHCHRPIVIVFASSFIGASRRYIRVLKNKNKITATTTAIATRESTSLSLRTISGHKSTRIDNVDWIGQE